MARANELYVLMLREDFEGGELLGVYDTESLATAAREKYVVGQRRYGRWGAPRDKGEEVYRNGSSTLRIVRVVLNEMPASPPW